MRGVRSFVFAIFLAAPLLNGCAYLFDDPVMGTAVAGGAAGAGAGAGIGALIGNNMAHGDVGQSALVGAAIGLPVGAALALGIREAQIQAEISRNQDQIEANQESIELAQGDIDEMRADMSQESRSIRVDDSHAEYRYDGPSLGQYNR